MERKVSLREGQEKKRGKENFGTPASYVKSVLLFLLSNDRLYKSPNLTFPF